MSTWPKSIAAGGMELELFRYTYESHHASGPQDNAGKDPRRAMDAAILHEKAATIYDYHRYMEWTTQNMPHPSAEHAHEGTWGANGEYHWRAFSNGLD